MYGCMICMQKSMALWRWPLPSTFMSVLGIELNSAGLRLWAVIAESSHLPALFTYFKVFVVQGVELRALHILEEHGISYFILGPHRTFNSYSLSM